MRRLLHAWMACLFLSGPWSPVQGAGASTDLAAALADSLNYAPRTVTASGNGFRPLRFVLIEVGNGPGGGDGQTIPAITDLRYQWLRDFAESLAGASRQEIEWDHAEGESLFRLLPGDLDHPLVEETEARPGLKTIRRDVPPASGSGPAPCRIVADNGTSHLGGSFWEVNFASTFIRGPAASRGSIAWCLAATLSVLSGGVPVVDPPGGALFFACLQTGYLRSFEHGPGLTRERAGESVSAFLGGREGRAILRDCLAFQEKFERLP